MTAEELAKLASVAVVTARKWMLAEEVRGLAAERLQLHWPRGRQPMQPEKKEKIK